jgi:hypothetical protein
MNIQLIIEICIIAIIIIAFLIWLFWQIKKQGLKTFAVEFIVYAEENIKYNEDKFDYVVEQLIKLIPSPLNFFITTSMVEKLTQNVFDFIKKSLDYRPNE